MLVKLFGCYLRLILLLTLFTCASVYAADNDWLNVKVNGINGALAQNVNAYLGDMPTSAIHRRAYLFSVKDKVEQALQSMGYYHGKISQQIQQTKKGPWYLTLSVTPGPVTKIQWVDVNFSPEMQHDPVFTKWLLSVKMKPGDALNQGTYEAVKNELLTLALSRGYFDAHYSRSEILVNRDLNTAQISLDFDSGKRYRIGDISFEGDTLEDGFLDRLIPFKPHSKYNANKLSKLNQRLLATGYFANIKVIPQMDQAQDQQIPIKVELANKPGNSFQIGIGADIGGNTTKPFDPRYRVTWKTPQINRYGHSQETTFEWSKDQPKFLTTYTIPLTHPLNDQLKIRMGILREQYGLTQSYNSNDHQFDNTGHLESTKRLFGVLRQQSLKHKWLLGYSVESIKESYTQSEIDYDPTFYLFGMSLQKTVRGDNSFDPKWGYQQIYSLDYADPALGSATRLARLQAKFKWIHTFFTKHRIVTRLDLGINYANDSDLALIPPSLRYFAGGDQSIRGYSYHELGPYIDYNAADGNISRQVIGGRYLAVGSFEYQYYLTPTWRVAAFVDAGNAFDKNQFEPIVSVGGGIHWISPIGPIKLDLGVGLKNTEFQHRSWRLHLTMGSDL